MSRWKFPQCATMTFTALLLLAGCVSQQKYDTLDTEYQQLNQTMSAEVAANQMQITRLQNAIKVTVNSELLFPSGDWQMPHSIELRGGVVSTHRKPPEVRICRLRNQSVVGTRPPSTATPHWSAC